MNRDENKMYDVILTLISESNDQAFWTKMIEAQK